MYGILIRGLVIFVLALVIYGGLAPQLVSSNSTLLVLIGLVLAISFPILVGIYTYKKVKKYHA